MSLQIINRTLNLMGRTGITSDNILQDDWASLISDYIEPCFKLLMNKYQFSFSVKEVQLQRAQVQNSSAFKYSYVLNSDILRINQVYDQVFEEGAFSCSNQRVSFNRYERRGLLLNSSINNAYIHYTSLSTDTSENDLFVETISYFIAEKLAPILLQDPKLAAYFMQQYQLYWGQLILKDVTDRGHYPTWSSDRYRFYSDEYI